jgi:membrane protein required for colicin V production
MAWIDLGIIAFIVLGSLRGLSSGLIRQVVTLASVIAGGVVAANLYPRLAANIDFMVSDLLTRQLVAFAAIFFGFLVLGQIAGQLLRTVASMLLLGPMDRLGGLVFGAAQSTLIVAFLLYAITAFPAIPGMEEQLAESVVAPYFIESFPLLQRLLPQDFRAAVAAFRQGDLPNLPIPGLSR